MLVHQICFSDRFFDQLRVLPRKTHDQIIAKVYGVLVTSPQPDGDAKQKIVSVKGAGSFYRLRTGDYRVIYSYGAPQGWVTLHAVERRNEETYDSDKLHVGHRPPIPSTVEQIRSAASGWVGVDDACVAEAPSPPPANLGPDPLPAPITEPMLNALGIDERYWPLLMAVATGDELLEAAVPAKAIERLLDVLCGGDIVPRPNEQTYEADSAAALLQMLDGDLPAVLLRLDDEQRRSAEWPARGQGPTLLRGGPGSGKSVVAAYRVRSLLRQLRAAGVAEPRILVTSYTNSLVNATRQLLERLVGDDMRFIDVRTADRIVGEVIARANRPYAPKDDGVARFAVKVGRNLLETDGAEGAALAAAIDRLSIDYLTQEIERCIVARDIATLDDYLAHKRVGRGVPLQRRAREAVWRVYEAYERRLGDKNYRTYAQTRRDAMRLVESGRVRLQYDAVVIDEAQDLDPTTIRLLIGLCASPDRLFLTADSGQQIYGNGFSWSGIHDELRLRGRVGTLTSCYRSTAEIGAAAAAWAPDPDRQPVTYRRHGPRPIAIPVGGAAAAATTIHDFIRAASRTLRVPIGSCAVLIPTNDVGHDLEHRLGRLGLPAKFSSGQALDLAGSAL
ncbi:MAG TPA: UvrD-helicase domain-containing protein, partial [Thermomicrobiales bacterium]|nr:UvrD-helicase domain-containing protein [Thermomicrobiales bacterium]